MLTCPSSTQSVKGRMEALMGQVTPAPSLGYTMGDGPQIDIQQIEGIKTTIVFTVAFITSQNMEVTDFTELC